MKECYGKCDRCIWKYNGGCCDQKGQDMTFEELLDKTLAELKSEYEQVKAMHDSSSTLKTET